MGAPLQEFMILTNSHFSFFPGPYTHAFFQRQDKYLAVAGLAGLSAFHYGFDCGPDKGFVYGYFKPYFAQQIPGFLYAPVDLGYAFLAAVSQYFAYGYQVDVFFVQLLLYFLQPVRLDDGYD
jgi:hypothetical protein